MTTPLSIVQQIFPASLQSRVLLVGGSVRDMQLGREGKDIDLITVLSAEELRALGFRLVETVSATPIYFKHLPESGTIEATRLDSMDGLEADLRRRDFTINALAMTISGEQIDPLRGAADVAGGILRACSDQIFSADPARIFRAFRFAADGWQISSETAALIRRQEWPVLLSTLPVERFSGEMLKALGRKTPEIFFEKMIEFQVGSEILPELFPMPHIPAGPIQHHPEGDLFTHSVQVLQRLSANSSDPLARFCAFFHDIGKLSTPPALYPKHHGHDSAGFGRAVELCSRLCLPLSHRKALAWVSSLHGKANLWDQLRDATKLTIAEQAIKAGIVDILPLVAAADKAGGLPMPGWEEMVRIAGLNSRELGIDTERLEALPTASRSPYILQKRVELLRSTT